MSKLSQTWHPTAYGKTVDSLLSNHFNPLFVYFFRFGSDAIRKDELDNCFCERYTEGSDIEPYRQLEIHLSEGNFQREFWFPFSIVQIETVVYS